jgi:hypothetical protein
MIKVLAQCAFLTLVSLPSASIAEPITLKLAFFSSDRSLTPPWRVWSGPRKLCQQKACHALRSPLFD